MASLKGRVTGAVAHRREQWGWFDHLLRMLSHYGTVGGNAQAGSVTFFGFLSFFPILGIAFFVVGLLAQVYPDVRSDLVQQINTLLPGVLGDGTHGTIELSTIEDSAGKVGVIGLVAVLYSGLGWLSGLRQALETVFSVPKREQPNFVFGKLRDLASLGLIGLTLLLSVVLSGAVTGFSGQILQLVGIDPDSTVPVLVLNVVARALAVAASVVLLMTMFELLADSHLPRRSLLSGALLGAIGFEVLKAAANLLLGSTKGQPAFQAFGVALILLVWINYFSRLVMYAAAWAYTAPAAVAQRAQDAVIAPGAALAPGARSAAASSDGAAGPVTAPADRPRWVAVGAAVGAAVTAVVVRRRRR